MPGIPPDLYQQLRATLLSCGPFGGEAQLRAVFVDERIHVWRYGIPQASSAAGQVDAIIAYLLDKYNTRRENALVLFLRVLSERVVPDDACYDELAQVTARLERELAERPYVARTGQVTNIQPDVLSSYETGLRRLLSQLGYDHPRYTEVLTYQQRLIENIDRVRLYGDTERSRAERAEIIAQINQLTLSVLDMSFNELCLGDLAAQPAETTPIAKGERRAPSSGHGVDFVLVTALEEERDALLDKLPGYRKLSPLKEDIRTYFQAELPVTFPDGESSVYGVIVMPLLGMGRLQAAAATKDAITRWHPRYIVMVGIAGGVAAQGINIGDILIADQIVDYELQKITPQGPKVRWEIQRADPRLLGACHNFMGEDWQDLLRVKRPGRSKPKRHIGPIASGDKVIAFGDVLERYREAWPKLVGVEMEASGVATAAFQSPDPPGFFMVRCVSDLADEHKDAADVEKWRSYACDVAASFAIKLLKSGPVPLPSDRKPETLPRDVTPSVPPIQASGKLTASELLQVLQQAASEHWTLLDLSGRGLTELPSEIGRLTQLQRLDLRDNQLASLPSEIAHLTNLERLDLRYNPFLPIPPEILQRVDEPAVVIDFYLESQNQADTAPHPLNEIKVILVGQGSVGKTSLVKRLIGRTFDPDETKTKGINVCNWYVQADKERLCLNVWDLGGQDIMHATHQFFLTRRSLYLLVLDARKGEQESNIEYWLKLIQSFGEESPIIVVINKVDEHLMHLNRRGLQEKYPTIRAFVNTSCKDGTGIDDLLKIIVREVSRLPHIHTPWPKSWFAVKRRLEKMGRDFISYDAYQNTCVETDITNETDQRALIAFLHDLGVVLNYSGDPRLEETSILNPEWVTRAVYEILNSNALFHSKGILRSSQLEDLLDPKRYPPHKRNFIIGIMQKFELCFPLDGADGASYLIPDLLPIEEPFLNWPAPENCLLFQYAYQVLPSSVMTRFTVRMHSCVNHNTYWRTGVVLSYQDNGALVKADLEERRVTISITGQEETRREFLAIIRSNFDHIHRTIPRIEAKAQVPIPGHPDIAVDYQHLLTLEQLGQETFVPSGLSTIVKIKPLLDGVDVSKSKTLPAQRERERKATPSQSLLLGILTTYFDAEELRMLCFVLGIDYDNIRGEGKSAKARELIAYLERRERLSDLVALIKKERPNVSLD